ncbi:MAG: homoserine dehydrogenase [Lachnospiraceae bacterium]|nr:homoserine dehydrogenase [Lachnospiraceae bacterium]
MINVSVLGYGTIGSGVVEVINTNNKKLKETSGEEIKVKYVLDLREFEGNPVQKILVHDYSIIANDPEVDIVVEAMGGVHPAYDFVKEALEKGKSVCTSNKELVAAHGAELLEVAKAHNVNFFFEASVGGGIPIIRPLNECITADEIEEITGILNGTTNYILTKMSKEGAGFEETLKDAQDKGYAERNPEADVEGHDACRKIAILTSLACGKQVNYEDIYTEGITKISDVDFKYAGSIGASVKLFGTSKKVGDEIYAMVSPVMINETNPLYSVSDVFNAVLVKGNMLGNTMFYGAGAGKLPTASAVVSDVVQAVRHAGETVETRWSKEPVKLGEMGQLVNRFFVRVAEGDKAKAQSLFANATEVKADVAGEYAFITEAMKEEEFSKKAEEINVINRIRVAF